MITWRALNVVRGEKRSSIFHPASIHPLLPNIPRWNATHHAYTSLTPLTPASRVSLNKPNGRGLLGSPWLRRAPRQLLPPHTLQLDNCAIQGGSLKKKKSSLNEGHTFHQVYCLPAPPGWRLGCCCWFCVNTSDKACALPVQVSY